MTATTTARPVSEKQVALITRLADEKDVPTAGATIAEADILERLDDVLGGVKFVSTREASAVIDYLFSRPRKAQAGAVEAKAGYYVKDGEVYVVVISKSSGKPYAKHLEITRHETGNRASWVYAPGVAGRVLAALEPLTVEEAARLGHLHGVCVICAKQLTDPKSVERGIGPVCAKKL